MTLALFKIVLAVVVLIVAIIGGLWPFLKKARYSARAELEFPGGEAVACGIFLGAGLLHMLPDAVEAFTKAGYSYPFPFLIAGTSFLLLLLLEHISVSLKPHARQGLSSIALLTAVMLSIHALLEGAAVGLAMGFATTLIIFIAIIAHKGAAGFALAMNLNRSRLSLTLSIITFSVFALMTPLGILGGDWLLSHVEQDKLLTPIFSSLAAGTFLYMGTLHGLERASLIRHCCNMREFFLMLAGFIVMAGIAVWT